MSELESTTTSERTNPVIFALRSGHFILAKYVERCINKASTREHFLVLFHPMWLKITEDKIELAPIMLFTGDSGTPFELNERDVSFKYVVNADIDRIFVEEVEKFNLIKQNIVYDVVPKDSGEQN